METQTPNQKFEANNEQSPSRSPVEFTPGSQVVYALHGRCSVAAVESREINGESILFYKLEVQKSALSRSTRQEPAIWLPVNSAHSRGLRPAMNQEQATAALAILSNREYYFQPSEPWSILQPKLEACIRQEGAIGMAKAMSFLHVYKRKQIVPAPEVARFQENLSKLLLRELSEATQEPIRKLEEQISKGLRQKLIPDT